MDENRFRFGVGVLVVAAVGVFVILTFLFGAFPTLLSNEHPIVVRFPKAPGIGVNTAVLRDGVKIGRVSDIQLVNDGVEITMQLNPRNVPTREYGPRIGIGSFVTGEANLEFVKLSNRQLVDLFDGQAGSSPDGTLDQAELKLRNRKMTENEFIEYGQVESNPLNVVVGLESQVRATLETLQTAGIQIQRAGKAVEQLSDETRVSIQGGGDDIKLATKKINKVFDDFSQTLAGVRALVEHPGIKKTLNGFPNIIQEVENTLVTTQQAIENLEPIRKDAEQVTHNVAQITGAIAERSEDFAEGLVRAVRQLNGTLAEAETFVKVINQSDGTVRRLIEDDDLYWQFRQVMDNVESASKRIKPILNDVRILSDKLARDPRQLGVKGALDRRPSRYGLK